MDDKRRMEIAIKNLYGKPLLGLCIINQLKVKGYWELCNIIFDFFMRSCYKTNILLDAIAKRYPVRIRYFGGMRPGLYRKVEPIKCESTFSCLGGSYNFIMTAYCVDGKIVKSYRISQIDPCVIPLYKEKSSYKRQKRF